MKRLMSPVNYFDTAACWNGRGEANIDQRVGGGRMDGHAVPSFDTACMQPLDDGEPHLREAPRQPGPRVCNLRWKSVLTECNVILFSEHGLKSRLLYN
jgi:hypothetical protein